MTQANSAIKRISESLVFNNRLVVLIVFIAISIWFGVQASKIQPDASLERMIPLDHPYVVNFLEHQKDLENLANFIRISVEAKEGDIFNAEYMSVLESVSNEVFYLSGVDRSGLKSLWTPNVRWVEVTEDGFQGGAVIPTTYDGSEASLQQLRKNILRSGEVGRLVANNFKSSIVYVPLLETNPETGERLDYLQFSRELETKIRDAYAGPDAPVRIQIVGFAKKIGDLMEGLTEIVYFFGLAVLITSILFYVYARCAMSTVLCVFSALVAVIWQVGLMHVLGYGLDPYAVLIPFIVFATAVSHGVQFINGVMHSVGVGGTAVEGAKDTFSHHFVPAMLALVSDALGFLTLVIIEVDVIQSLAIGASLGIASIIFTNMLLLPVLVSYFGVTQQGIRYAIESEKNPGRIWYFLSSIVDRKNAFIFVVVAQIGVAAGLYFAEDLKIGELDAGAPELRPDSRYNLDNDFITTHYKASADVMVVMVKTPAERCNAFPIMDEMERLQWRLNHTTGVQSTLSIVDISKIVTKAFNEGSLNWFELSRNQKIIDTSIQQTPTGFINSDCSLATIFVFLDDHRAETLRNAVEVVEQFSEDYLDSEARFLLAAGNAGIEAATNQVIDSSQDTMMLFVYAVVGLMVLVAYRSISSVACVVLPLCVTSVLCMALMATLGIGVKVSTLPIIALGVGLGVDYGIYIFSQMKEYMEEGESLQDAYFDTVRTTGKAVGFTGLTLAISTATWIFSPIKFQADMGVLLTFMFLWNMVGAMTLLPALASYLLSGRVEYVEHLDRDATAS